MVSTSSRGYGTDAEGPQEAHTHTLLRIFHETVSSNSDSVSGILPASSMAQVCIIRES